MFYIGTDVTGAPNVRIESGTSIFGLLQQLIEGVAPIKPDAVEGQKILFNNKFLYNELCHFVVSDGVNSVMSELEKINDNEYYIKKDITTFNHANVMLLFPKLEGFEIEKNGSNYHLKNSFGELVMPENTLNQRLTGYIKRGSQKNETVFFLPSARDGYSLLYSETGFILTVESNGRTCVYPYICDAHKSIATPQRTTAGNIESGYDNLAFLSRTQCINGIEQSTISGYNSFGSQGRSYPLSLVPIMACGIQLKEFVSCVGSYNFEDKLTRFKFKRALFSKEKELDLVVLGEYIWNSSYKRYDFMGNHMFFNIYSDQKGY